MPVLDPTNEGVLGIGYGDTSRVNERKQETQTSTCSYYTSVLLYSKSFLFLYEKVVQDFLESSSVIIFTEYSYTARRRDMKVLVTGSSGNLGRMMVEEFKKSYKVVGFDVKEPIGPIGKSVRFIKGDLRKLGDVENATKEINVIIHLAAIPFEPKDQKLLFDTNIMGTFNVLESAVRNNVKRVIFISTSLVVGHGYTTINSSQEEKPMDIQYLPFDEEYPCQPNDMYGFSKYIGEQMCKIYTKKYGISTICLRLGAIAFSPENHRKFFEQKESWYKYLYRNLWVYEDARDVIQACKLSIEIENIEHEVFNISAEDHIGQEDTLSLIKKYYPTVKNIKTKGGFLLEERKTFFDIGKAQRVLGYTPHYSFENFIKRI